MNREHASITGNTDRLNEYIEPVFYLGRGKNRRIPFCFNSNRAVNNFEYSLKKSPADLSSHLQRIHYSAINKKRDALFSALCDLFIVLGENGIALRKRLKTDYRKCLSSKQGEYLNRITSESFLKKDDESLPEECLFKESCIKTLRISARMSQDKNENISSIVDSYIENSQFDAAIEYMKVHLEKFSEDENITVKLISLYQSLNLEREFMCAYKKLSRNKKTGRYWEAAKECFIKNHDSIFDCVSK